MKVSVNEGGVVRIRGKVYEPGSILDLPDAEAERLMGKGVVSILKKAPSSRKPRGADG